MFLRRGWVSSKPLFFSCSRLPLTHVDTQIPNAEFPGASPELPGSIPAGKPLRNLGCRLWGRLVNDTNACPDAGKSSLSLHSFRPNDRLVRLAISLPASAQCTPAGKLLGHRAFGALVSRLCSSDNASTRLRHMLLW